MLKVKYGVEEIVIQTNKDEKLDNNAFHTWRYIRHSLGYIQKNIQIKKLINFSNI
jgi:hypothetical protein